MQLFKRIQHTVAMLAGVVSVHTAIPAYAQTEPTTDTIRTTTIDADEAPVQVDPCAVLTIQALRMARGCVGSVTPPDHVNGIVPPRVLLTPDDVVIGLLPPEPLPATPYARADTRLVPCSALKAPAADTRTYPHDTVVVVGRRPCDSDSDAIYRAYHNQLEAEFGNQPSDYDQFAAAISSPFGRMASNFVINMGFSRFGDDADKAAQNEIQDALADLIIGDAHSCGDPMESPERRRDREFMGQFMAQQRGVMYDACRR